MGQEIRRTDDGYEVTVDGGAAIVPVEARANALWVTLHGSAARDVRSPELTSALLAAATDDAAAQGAAAVHVVGDIPLDRDDPVLAAAAAEAGFGDVRDLFQLRRPLPVAPDDPGRGRGPHEPLAVRPFRPGTGDEAAWIAVNNAAFAHHPDQGHETAATLHARMAEPWFDPAGFLVLDDDLEPDHLAGFCWTKVHPPSDDDPAMGEIYVIGVHPDRGGSGLGRRLVLAGLDHLAARGLGLAMLYVDATNAAALALYDQLGFVAHHRSRVRTRTLS